MDNNENIKINKPQPLNNKKMSRKERKNANLPDDPIKGRALHKWTAFFFVLTCIGAVLTAAMLALPVLLALFGIVSVLLWLVVIVVASIFTLFLIWTTDEMKNFSSSWREFNDKIFTSSNATNELALRLIPSILISGGVIILITWIFVIVGLNVDQERHKKYKGKMIALIVISVIYLIFLAINIYVHYCNS